MGEITAPAPITGTHILEPFDCGEPVLDDWLKRRALKNETADASRTFVVCVDRRVVGYYALSAGSVTRATAPSAQRRNMPDAIPVMIMGRLAVDRAWQRKGIGPGLLKDAILRCVALSRNAGIKALLVHALSDQAKAFYIHHGFHVSPLDPMTLLLALKDAQLCRLG